MNQPIELKIGQLAQQTGLAVGTLRYYSDLGLLKPVQRGDNNYRYYSSNASQQVKFIKKAQTLGFTLEEIKQILDVKDRGEKPCSLVQSLLNRKIEQLEIQIEQMSLFKAELEEYRAAWTNNSDLESKPQEVCPLISSVSLSTFNRESKAKEKRQIKSYK
jgi:DNA-binding transcriptional MerR regulator